MGLRDRLSANYFIPLFAGTDSAARAGLLAPPEVYAPGLNPGGGGVGGIGAGDGGNETPDDPTINKPSITYPENGDTVDRHAVATSSEFSSTNGQTHIKSRWVIEYRGETDDSTDPMPFVIYDSGPTATDLTSLDMTDLLGAGVKYAIKVRYKGSGGGWSPWSDYVLFNVVCQGEGTSTTYGTTQQLWYWGTAGSAHAYLDPVQGCADRFGGTGTYTSPGSGECYLDGVYQGSLSTGVGCYRGEGSITTINPLGTPGDPCTDPYVVTTPGEDTCTDNPDMPDVPPSEPPAPIFVPPASQPPVPPPLPGVPPAQQKFAKIAVDIRMSSAVGLNDIGNAEMVALSKVISDGGHSYVAAAISLHLVFQNTGNAPGCINYAVTTDSESVLVMHGDFLSYETDAGFQFNNQMTKPKEVCAGPGEFRVELLTLWMPEYPLAPESHIITVDIGDDSPLKLKLGFGEAISSPP